MITNSQRKLSAMKQLFRGPFGSVAGENLYQLFDKERNIVDESVYRPLEEQRLEQLQKEERP